MTLILTVIILGIDLVSKLIISRINIESSISLIHNFLYITYVKNTGAAFSMFDDDSILVLVVSFLIIMGICLYIYKNKPKVLMEKVSYALILGGAIGNFVNRIICGYVIDFIDIRIFGYNYPIFNLADTFIVIGVILLLMYTWRCNSGNKGSKL